MLVSGRCGLLLILLVLGLNYRIDPNKAVQGTKVLLLDDDILTLELFEFSLKQNGADVKTASSVAEALQILDSWIPDVLVTDIGMPKEDGYSFIEKIRCHNNANTIPLIAVTGYGTQADRKKLTNAGYSKILVKPVSPPDLVSSIEALLP
ncbi:MAG: response regulator [Acidobacteriota bacterium]